MPLAEIARIGARRRAVDGDEAGQFPAVTIGFDLAEGASLGEAVAAIRAAEAEIGMPDTISGSFAGDAAEFQRSLAGEPWLILAAIIVIYIVLGVLYESVDPPDHHPLDPALGRHRRPAGPAAVRAGSFGGGR